MYNYVNRRQNAGVRKRRIFTLLLTIVAFFIGYLSGNERTQAVETPPEITYILPDFIEVLGLCTVCRAQEDVATIEKENFTILIR